MKHNLATLIVLFIFMLGIGNVFSQNMEIKIDPRLKDYLSTEKIASLERTGSFKTAVYNYYLDNMYYISDVEPIDAQNMGPIYQLQRIDGLGTFNENFSVFDNKTFNPYLYEFNIPYAEMTYYVLDEGKKYLVIYSREEYAQNLKLYLRENNLREQ